MTPPFPLHLLAPPDPAALPLPPAAHPADGVRLLRGAVYRVLDGARPLELDLWLPEDAAGPLPVIVFVHGGAWRTGLRGDMGPRFRAWEPGPFARLARAGFAVACPSYRLSGEAPHPAQLEDLAAALAWLRTRAGDLDLDTDRTVLWGESAGGHLAALTALRERVAGCVTWYAPTDLAALAEDHPEGRFDPASPDTFEALLLGAAPADAPDRARAASPAHQAAPDAPPFLVLHGADDVIVPAGQAARLADALPGAELRLVEGGDHLWVGLTDEQVEECFEASLAFARKVRPRR
ncbi:alpha/beta fold hydrolase [Spirillospora sp. NPDC050679]